MYQKPMHPVKKLDLWKKTQEMFSENKNSKCPNCNKKYITKNGKKHCDCNPINEEDERKDISLCDQALNIIKKLNRLVKHNELAENEIEQLNNIIIKLKKREQAEQEK